MRYVAKAKLAETRVSAPSNFQVVEEIDAGDGENINAKVSDVTAIRGKLCKSVSRIKMKYCCL